MASLMFLWLLIGAVWAGREGVSGDATWQPQEDGNPEALEHFTDHRSSVKIGVHRIRTPFPNSEGKRNLDRLAALLADSSDRVSPIGVGGTRRSLANKKPLPAPKKQATAKKAVPNKAAAKNAVAKKETAKKEVPKKAAANKAVAKKEAAKKAVPKKAAPAKKTVAKPASKMSPGHAPGVSLPFAAAVYYEALQNMKNSIVEDPHGALKSWVGPNVCAYNGVVCETADSVRALLGLPSSTFPYPSQLVLTGLDLNGYLLGGPLSPSITKLQYLGYIHASSNAFTGSVPDLSPLVYLGEVDLSVNQLSGPFPEDLTRLSNLKYLDLRYNMLSGVVPSSVYNANLDVLVMNSNQLRHSSDSWTHLGNSAASILVLSHNPLGGMLPRGFTRLAHSVEEMSMASVDITGPIPPSLGACTLANTVDLSSNQLTGSLPSTMADMKSLVFLDLSYNRLNQDIATLPVLSLPHLKVVAVGHNYLKGQLPSKVKPMVDDEGNCLSGAPGQRTTQDCQGQQGGNGQGGGNSEGNGQGNQGNGVGNGGGNGNGNGGNGGGNSQG